MVNSHQQINKKITHKLYYSLGTGSYLLGKTHLRNI